MFEKKFKAQAEGAVELLVGVIIMAIVLAIAFNLMQNVSTSQCLSQVKSEMSKMRDSLNEIAINSPPVSKTLTLALPNSCGNYRIIGIQLVRKPEPKYCTICGTTFGGCFQAIPIGKDRNGRYAEFIDSAVCIDLPGSQDVKSDSCPATFSTASSDPCGTPNGCGYQAPSTFTYKTIMRTKSAALIISFDKNSASLGSGGTIVNINVCAKEG